VKTSAVRDPRTGIYRAWPWTLPLILTVCRACGHPMAVVSAAASEAAVWDHVSAVHLGGQHASEKQSPTEPDGGSRARGDVPGREGHSAVDDL